MNYYAEITYDILADDFVICFIISFETEIDGCKFIEYFNNYKSHNKENLKFMNVDDEIKVKNKDKKYIDSDNFNKIINELIEFNENIKNKSTSEIYSNVKNNKFNNEYIDVITKFIHY